MAVDARAVEDAPPGENRVKLFASKTVSGLPDDAHKRTEALVFPADGYSVYYADKKIVGYAQPYLWPQHHIEIVARKMLVYFNSDKVPCSGYHVMKIGVHFV